MRRHSPCRRVVWAATSAKLAAGMDRRHGVARVERRGSCDRRTAPRTDCAAGMAPRRQPGNAPIGYRTRAESRRSARYRPPGPWIGARRPDGRQLLAWWQAHRSRLAIEVDCDRRVLRGGYDAHRYAKTLVDVSTRQPAYFGALAASPRSLSSVERRIILMNTPRIRGWRANTAACTLLSVGVAMATILISPPAILPALAGTAGAAEQIYIEPLCRQPRVLDVSLFCGSSSRTQLAAAIRRQADVADARVGTRFRFREGRRPICGSRPMPRNVLLVAYSRMAFATEAPRIDAHGYSACCLP